jgi:hypothetical protein
MFRVGQPRTEYFHVGTRGTVLESDCSAIASRARIQDFRLVLAWREQARGRARVIDFTTQLGAPAACLARIASIACTAATTCRSAETSL